MFYLPQLASTSFTHQQRYESFKVLLLLEKLAVHQGEVCFVSLFLVQFLHFFLDGILHDQSVYVYYTELPNSIHPIDSLFLHSRVPLGLHNYYVVCLHKVESLSAHSEGGHEPLQ